MLGFLGLIAGSLLYLEVTVLAFWHCVNKTELKSVTRTAKGTFLLHELLSAFPPS